MKSKIVFIALMGLMIFSFNDITYADTTIHLDIETLNNTVYNQDITVAPCDSDNDPITPDTITAYCALVQSGTSSDWSGLWINSINGISNDNELFKYWMWLANLNTDNTSPDSSYNLSAKQYELNENDKILFYFDTNPLIFLLII
jgi:hypothetical protein